MADRNRTPQPLVDNQKIVTQDGFPTQYFIRWAQERQLAIEGGITADQAQQLIVDYLAAHALQAGTGIAIMPSGSLSDDPTISLDASLGDLNDVDFSTPPTDGQVIVYDAATMTWKPADQSGGGGGSGTPPTVLSGVEYYFNAASYNANFPVGTMMGDLCVVGTNHAYAASTPAGWTSLSNLAGSNTNGAVFYKILDAGDIAAGHVTINYGGGFDGCVGMIIYDSTTVTGISLSSDVRHSGSTGSNTLAAGLLATDNLFIYGGSHGNGVIGFSLGTITDQQHSGSASGAVGTYQPTAITLASETITFADDGSGNYSALVVVAGTPGGGGGGGTPAVVQFATLRNDGTITLGAAPTVGNLMVLVTGGFAGSIDGYVPAGFALVGGYNSDNNNGARCWGRVVQTGDTGSYAISASDNQSAVLYEFSGALTAATLSGGRLNTPGGAAWAINYLPSPFGKKNVILGVVENDSTVQWTVDALAGIAAIYIDGTGTGNHTCAFVQIDQATAGPTIRGTISSGGYNNPVYGLFAVIGD